MINNTGAGAVFLPSPTTTATILDKTTTANANSTSNEYTIALGVKADYTVHAGSYTGTFNLITTANPVTYAINYNTNTEDTVTGMPSTQASETIVSSITLSNNVPEREHYSFIGWCSTTPTTTDGTDSCSGTVYNPNGNGTDLTYGIDQTTANEATLYAMWQIDTFTCTKQYRLQNADGTWGNYIADGTETINYGSSCAYAKTVTDYKSSTGANGSQASTIETNVTDDVTVSLDFYRNTYMLNVSAGTPISGINGPGTYRWGQTANPTVTVSYYPTVCYRYETPIWTTSDIQLAENTGASVSFEMPKKNVSFTVTAQRTDLLQTIIFATNNGGSITFNNEVKTNGDTMTLYCGTYNLTGTVPTGHRFDHWDSSANAVANTTSLTTTYNVSNSGTLTFYTYPETYNQFVNYRYENADGTFTDWTGIIALQDYGTTYSWSTDEIANFDSTTYQAASVVAYTVTGDKTNEVTIYRNTFTCTKRYRLQNADGTWGDYVNDGSVTARYGGSCAYAKTLTDYKNAANGTNGAQASTTATNVTSNQTLSLSFYRNTYTLTVTASTNTSSATGGGTYRWGQTATVGVTKATNVTCTTYATPTWTASTGTAPAAGASSTYTMPKSNATVTATSAASNVAQTITLSRAGGATGITIAGTSYTGTSVSLTCGTYNITGTIPEHYHFVSWGATAGTLGATNTLATTYQVTGPATLTLTSAIDTNTCTKRYRLQNADGTWGNYANDGTEAIAYNGTCSYSKTVTDYKNAANGTNGAAASTSASNMTSAQTLSLDFYRNTYSLTVSAGSNTSAATGGGTYRWGQTATVGVTKAANVTCTTYATPTWTQSGTAGTFSATSGTSVNFTMGKGNATVTAASTASNVAQTITFKTSNATSISLNGTSKTNNQTMSINCGTYNLTGVIPANHHFVSWAATAGTVAATNTLSTTYTVSGAATITLTGAIDTYTQTTRYRYENADGTWGSWTTAESVSKDYGSSYSWSTSSITNFNSTAYQATSVASYTVTAAKTNDVNIYRKTFTCTKQYRLQNADGTYPSTYTAGGTESIRYGATCSYTTSANTTIYTNQTKSVSNVTAAQTISVDVPRKTFTCTKRYRLQNADGTFPSTYTSDGSVTAYYGGSCAYAKSVTDYKNAASGTNNAQASTTATNVTAAQTLSLDFYRNTFTLTVTASTNTSSATGGGTYRWGQTATVGVTKATNVTCTTYATPTWTQSGTAGTFSATSGTSVNFTMGKGNVTVTATSAASNVAQTITLSRGTGVASIKIGSTNYTAASVSLNCGTYNISGNYNNNYEFSSWARANGVAVTSTTTASTTMTVTGAGTLTLNAKQSKLYMQELPANSCPTTRTLVYDNRDEKPYYIQKITAGDRTVCWMTQSLDLAGGTALTPSNTNITANYTLPASANDYASYNNANNTAVVYNSNSTNCANRNPCYSYYTYKAVKAGKDISAAGGTSTSGSSATHYKDFSYDICPKGWRLPTYAETKQLISTYNTYDLITVAPFYGVTNGRYSGGTTTGFSGSNSYYYGYYWLASYGSQGWDSSSSGYVYYPATLEFYNYPSVSVSTNLARFGLGVRCVNTSFDNTIRTMQELGALSGTNKTNALSKMTVGEYYSLSDARDDKIYSVAKLADGNVWMTSNLNLNGGVTLTSATSNVTSNYTLPASNYSGWSSNSSAYVYNADNMGGTCDGSNPCESYYSWRAVTAGTAPTSGNTSVDICPKGWRLPTQAEYNTLATKYTTHNALVAAPFRSQVSGEMYDSGFSSGMGYYWTATAKDSTRSYIFQHVGWLSGSTPTTTEAFPYRGYAVRCILKP